MSCGHFDAGVKAAEEHQNDDDSVIKCNKFYLYTFILWRAFQGAYEY